MEGSGGGPQGTESINSCGEFICFCTRAFIRITTRRKKQGVLFSSSFFPADFITLCDLSRILLVGPV